MGNVCLQCHFEMSESRLNMDPAVCNHCGYISNLKHQKEADRFQNRLSLIIIGSGILAILLFTQLVFWQNHALTILPLKIKSTFGIDSQEALKEIADICMKTMKYSCVRDSYLAIIEDSPNDLDTLDKLAKIEHLMGERQAAIKHLDLYFSNGGRSYLAAHRYAKLLDVTGQPQLADNYYKMALSEKTDIVQVTVTQDYVRFLKNQARYKEAKDLILHYRKNGASINFLSQEFEELKQILKSAT